MVTEFLRFSPKIACLPVIHGSGDYSVEVRNIMLSNKFDCIAVPLPPSFQSDVETAIDSLPGISLVVQEESSRYDVPEWTPDSSEDDADARRVFSYVPIDPCQPVIAAVRIALQEHIHRAFIDLEVDDFIDYRASLPDPYALKKVPADRFSGALLPAIPAPQKGQATARIQTMAARLRQLESKYESTLLVCSLLDWPWIRDAYTRQTEPEAEDAEVNATEIYSAAHDGLLFTLGELPYITGLYESARFDLLGDDQNLSIDGIKDMAVAARDAYKAELKGRARQITPHLLSVYFRYVRNLSLVERRMTPDLYTLVIAAQQIGGDQFAIQLADMARYYPFDPPAPYEEIRIGIKQSQLPDGDLATLKSRLPGNAISWRTCALTPQPPKRSQEEWRRTWNPFGQCSWPPEDNAIENFRTRIKDAALDLIGNDLARSEKFSTSLKDGLDIRETLRNWHTGDLFVKVFPPARGSIDCVVMLFDSPADPRDYPWRITWHAEHHDESTLSLFATDFSQDMVGPGIAMATYGGCMFLFPPRPIVNIWLDKRFDFCDTLEERLVAAGSCHSNERHIAILSYLPPGIGFRNLAKRYGKKLVHVPLGRFSQETVQQLRMFHVLNGQQIRSYAAHFIRKA
jgi:hypothetical protein